MKDEYEAKPYLGTYYYVINLTARAAAASRRLREALALAIDREVDRRQDHAGGSFLPAYSWVPPGIPDYTTQYVSLQGHAAGRAHRQGQGAAGRAPATARTSR